MDELRTKLKWLMALRVVVVTLLLGISIALQVGKGELVLTYYALIVFTYAITIGYAVAFQSLSSVPTLTRFASLQLGTDLLLETFLVGRTGGIESPFSVLYVITVVLASLILRRQGGLAIAGGATILFGLVTNVQFYGLLGSWLPPSRLILAEETFYTLALHVGAFLAVGFLSGLLAEQLRRTDQSLVEKERGLRRLQAFHEDVIQSLSTGVFTTDAAGKITSFNRAAREITGYALGAVLGRLWWDVFNWQQGDLFGADPLTLTHPYRFEAEGRRSDESRVVLGMTLSALTEGGVQTGLVGVFQDLTQIRDLETEVQRREWLARIGEMSAGMAHEIRNPLAALAGSLQMLQRDLPTDESSRRLMDIAVREATRLDGIITQFLHYARPGELNLKECDLNEVLADTLDLIGHEGESREGVTVATYPGPGPMTAQVDQDQMKQVFWNLATNAFEAMPSGGQLTISTRRRRVVSGSRIGDVIEINFEDTGEGIRKEDLDRIFLPFFTTKGDGSGLGLATVHRIVDQHGGWVRVESWEGKGSRFAVCLPVSTEAGPRLWHEGREPWKRS